MSNTNAFAINAANVADYNTSHYIELPVFQPGMLDELRRDFTILQRITTTPATGHPSRYWEQTKLPQNTGAIDVRGGSTGYTGYSKNTLDEDYGRVEKSLLLKAYASRIKFTLFDQELVRQQETMEFLLNKDLNDMMTQFYRKKNQDIWTGAAETVMDSTKPEYCGLLTQIGTPKATIAAADTTTKISTVIRNQIAKQVADTNYNYKVTAIYANPLSIDLLENELIAENPSYRINSYREIVPGVSVPSIRTQAGELPIIPDPYVPVVDNSTSVTHRFVIMDEKMVERHYLTTAEPRIFKMSQNENLIDDYIALGFDGVVLKGGSAFVVAKEVAKS